MILAQHHEQDIFKMGGLRRRLPVTFAVFVIAGASLAGFPLVTAGFYSKDTLLWAAWASQRGGFWLWLAGLAGAFVTSLYVFRLIFVVFLGQPRRPIDHRPGYRIKVPLVILAVLSIVGGFVEIPATLGDVPLFTDLLDRALPAPELAHGGLAGEYALQGLAAAASLAGIALAWVLFVRRPRPEEHPEEFPGIGHRLHRFWVGPTAGSVILAGLLLKTGAYGLLRFALPLFPEASRELAPAAMALGAAGVVYGAVLAFAQTDLKRLVAYSSVSHLGFVLLGIFAWNELALQGAVMTMICHGLSTGALFVLVGQLKERLHTRDLAAMGGLAELAPRMAALAIFFAMASLGLPGLGNFVGEFLVLLGSFKASVAITAVATVGLVGATIYSLWIVQKAFHGPLEEGRTLTDLGAREVFVLGVLVVALVWLGLWPQPVLETAEPALAALRDLAAATGVLATR